MHLLQLIDQDHCGIAIERDVAGRHLHFERVRLTVVQLRRERIDEGIIAGADARIVQVCAELIGL